MRIKEKSPNSQGFAHLGLIIIMLIVIAAVALGGWYVWQKESEDSNQSNNTGQTNNDKQDQQDFVAPEGWKFYKNDEAGLSFYYPPEWGNVEKLGVEAREVGGGKFYKFTSLDKLRFSVHEHDREVPSLEFGNIEPAVIDAFLENGEPAVELASGFEVFRDFTSNHVIKKLNGNKICLAEDYYLDDYMGDDPFADDSARSHTYFGYCGLISKKFGAFTISSGQRDDAKSETQELKNDITGLLKTFENF